MESLNKDYSIKKILVPVDYSGCSLHACRYAIKLAGILHAELRFFHVYNTPSYDMIELSGTVEVRPDVKNEVAKNLEAFEKANMDSFIASLQSYFQSSKNNSIIYSSKIITGIPAEGIINYSQLYQPDLVIMGTRGKHKAVNLLGSVVSTIIKKLGFPVLTIPEEYIFIGEENIKNLLFVTEFDESDFFSIRKLMNISVPLDLTIHCIHAGLGEGEWDKLKMDGLKEYFKKAYQKTDVECGFVDGRDLINEIEKISRAGSINVIAVTSHRRNLFEKLFKQNLTTKLFHHTQIPILVFPSRPE